MTLLTPDLLPTKSYPFSALRYLLQKHGKLREGVVGAGDLAVAQRAAGANMSVDVAAGDIWVQGDDVARQGIYHLVNDAAANVAVGANASGNPRLDQIVARIYDSSIVGASDTPTLECIPGTPSATATLDNRSGAAALPNGACPLADVIVANGAASIVTANIRDRRPPSGFLSKLITTSEVIASTSYKLAPTPDMIPNVALPAGGILWVLYQATWQESVASAARAAIHLNSNQLKGFSPAFGTANQLLAASINGSSANSPRLLATTNNGLASTDTQYGGDATTGQVPGISANGFASTTTMEAAGSVFLNASAYGACLIFADAGTYDVSVRFKSSSGNVTVSSRRLVVGVLGG